MTHWSGFGALGAGLGVAVSWLCCLPFAAALGAGVTAAGAALTPYQPLFALASVALLGVAIVQTVRAQKCEDGSCEPLNQKRRWWFLGAIALTTVVLVTLPVWSSYLIYWSL